MMETLGALINSKNVLKLLQDGSGRLSVLRIPYYMSGGGRIRINDILCNKTPEKNKALCSTSYTGRTMKMKMIF